MTGATIYLVSACASGEEFIAAFRRYADKNGLFVPIADPLPAGARSRFAVTLKDGGVMIEGEAEIISSAKTASVLHGRVGMKLRFLETDDASKTTLGELERARLAMRPAPPSIPPRPAQLPAAPRPVPPPVQGRIDAVNALAECVAIGDTSALAPGLPGLPPAPPKAGPRFVAPGPSTPGAPSSGLGVAQSTSSSSRPAAAAAPIVMAAQEARDLRDTLETPPPSITPRATPQPESLRRGLERRDGHAGHPERPDLIRPARPAEDASAPRVSGDSHTMIAVSPQPAPIPAGPSSDTIVAAAPPVPPGTLGAPAAPPIAAAPSAVAPPVAPLPSDTLVGTVLPGVSPAAQVAPRRAVEMPVAVPRAVTRPGTPAPLAAEPYTRGQAISTSMTAVPAPAAGPNPPSSPTDIGGVLVEPLAAHDAEGEPAGEPPIAIVATTPARDDASARTQVHAGVPRRDPFLPTLGSHGAAPGPSHHAPHVPAAAPPHHGMLPGVRTLVGGPVPAPPIVPPAATTTPEVEIGEPTDLWSGPPEPPPAVELEESTSPEVEAPLDGATPIEMMAFPDAAAAAEASGSRPRRTAIGVAIAPPGVTVLPAHARAQAAGRAPLPGLVEPAARMPDLEDREDREDLADLAARGAPEAPRALGDPGDHSLLAAEEATGSDVAAPTLPAEPRMEAPSRGDWTMPPARLAGLVAPGAEPPAATAARGAAPPASAAPTASAAGLPSGDWTIALDPQAPDGWSEPFELVSPAQISDPPAHAAHPAHPVHPAHGAPAITVASAQPLDSVPRRPTPHPDGRPSGEPKVQIDPTLIEPPALVASDTAYTLPPEGALRPMPPDGSLQLSADELFRHTAASSQDLPSYHAVSAAATVETPPMALPMGMPIPPTPLPYGAPPGSPMIHGQAPAYPLDPSYQMVPVGLPAPHTLPPSSSGPLGDPLLTDAMPPVSSGRRRAIIVLVSAVIAVLVGIAALLVSGKRDAASPGNAPELLEPPPGTAPAPRPGPAPAAPGGGLKSTAASVEHSNVAMAAPAPPAGDTAPATPTARSTTPATTPATAPATTPASTAPATCFADITSQPAGAEIIVDESRVLGTTPQKVELPCGAAVELTIRKPRLIAVTRTVTPTPEGAPLKVALARQTFLIKVSSTPPGAAITLNGKPLGVTPTTVKVPAFEASMLALTKDGYAPETQKVAPKTNGVSIHASLKKLDRKRPDL